MSYVKPEDPAKKSGWLLKCGKTGDLIKRIVLHTWQSFIAGGIDNVQLKSRDFDPQKA